MDKLDVLEHLMAALSALPQDQLTRRENTQTGPKLQRLDSVRHEQGLLNVEHPCTFGRC